MIGVSYNSKHSFNDFKIVAKSIDRPLLPAARKQEIEVAGMDGTLDFGIITYGNRPIRVLLQYVGDTFADLRLKSREIAFWLSQSTYKRLIFDDEPDKFYLAKVYDEVGLVVEDLLEFGKATVTFECQPFAYSVDEDVWFDRVMTDAEIIQNGGTYKVFPVIEITPISLSGDMDEAVEVTGVFDPAAPVLVTTVTNPAITIGDNTLLYTGTLTDGQTLIIDTAKWQATKGGLNVLNMITGDWLFLDAGDNELSFTDETSECGTTIKITYRKRWL